MNGRSSSVKTLLIQLTFETLLYVHGQVHGLENWQRINPCLNFSKFI
jgi:hypothetical protein